MMLDKARVIAAAYLRCNSSERTITRGAFAGGAVLERTYVLSKEKALSRQCVARGWIKCDRNGGGVLCSQRVEVDVGPFFSTRAVDGWGRG